MRLSKLAEYCKEMDINCEECLYKENCENLSNMLYEISPFGVVSIVEQDIDI